MKNEELDKKILIGFADTIEKVRCVGLLSHDAIMIRVAAFKGLIKVTNKILKDVEKL